MNERVTNKVALITGAARGQGRSHCLRLAGEGADIIALDLCEPVETISAYEFPTEEDLAETAAGVRALGRRVFSAKVDVRDGEAVSTTVERAVAELGRLDVVVANAAVVGYGSSWEISPAEWQTMLDVNLTGVWNTTRAAVPHLIHQGRGGSIIVISSIGGVKGLANVGHYVATKHGVIGLVRSMANELGMHSIRVNAIAPTNVDTPFLHNQEAWGLFVPDEPEPTLEQVSAAMVTMHALPVPWVECVDVSNAVLFLASDEARYVTGAILPVDAGASIR